MGTKNDKKFRKIYNKFPKLNFVMIDFGILMTSSQEFADKCMKE